MVLRFDKPVGVLKVINKRCIDAKQKKNNENDYFKLHIVSDMCLIFFYFTDHFMFIDSVKFLPVKTYISLKIEDFNNYFWFLNATLEIVISVFLI